MSVSFLRPTPTAITLIVMNAVVWAHLAEVRGVWRAHLEPGGISSLTADFPVLKLTKDLSVEK